MIHGKFYIGGQWLDGSARFDSVDPSTEESIGWAYEGGTEEISSAISAARTALSGWAGTPPSRRATYLERAVRSIRERYGQAGEPTLLKRLISSEMGKVPAEADVEVEVMEASDMLTFFASRGPEVLAETSPSIDGELWPTKRSLLRSEPVGVVALIKPWNYPFELPLWTIGAALVAGNCVILKPSEYTPLVALEIGKIVEEAELPPGVLNIVTGSAQTGRYLVEADGVDMVSFTGSVAAGRHIATQCGKRLRRVSLELGGKDPAIVMDDADVELAANGITWGAFGNAGQVCTAVERAYVHESVMERLVDLVVQKTSALRLGIDIPPLVSASQLRKVEDHVADAVSKGARVLVGGRRSDSHAKGYFYPPTVLTHVDESMRIMTEETFGPVLPIASYSDLSEAIRAANSTAYGLGASVWSSSRVRSSQVADQLEAGMVWINDVNVPFPQCPWSGVKESGIGVELSDRGVLEFARIKHVSVELGDQTSRSWWYPYAD